MSERTLILLRHAKSDWSGNHPDIDRPLAQRGRRQAPETGRWLNANIDRLDLAVVSPAVRARSTWELVSSEQDVAPPTRTDVRVYGATGSELLAVVRDVSDDFGTVVLVGHNPGLEDLVHGLTDQRVRMPTSALAVVVWSGSWSTAGESFAELRACGRPPTERSPS